jgi:hypothetical protein
MRSMPSASPLQPGWGLQSSRCGKLLADELAQWTAVVKAANIRVE